MKPLGHVRMDLMSSKQVAAYLQKSDLLVLPVGCFEMHGPLLPLGTDTIHTWAMGLLLAEQWQGLCLPPVNYSFPGASGPWPGTIEISPEATVAYIQAVAEGALRAGFSRLVLCGSHGPLAGIFQSVIRSIYLASGRVVAAVSPYQRCLEFLEAEFGRAGEDLKTLGALHIMGWDTQCDVATETEIDIVPVFPFDEIGGLKQVAASVPWVFTEDHQHTGIHNDYTMADAPRAAAALEKAAVTFKDLPGLFASYQEKMKALREDAPWTKPGVWSV